MSWYRQTLGLTRQSLGRHCHPSRARRLGVYPELVLKHQYSTEQNPESSTISSDEGKKTQDGCLFIDSVFPLTLWRWDLRYLFGYLREEALLDQLYDVFEGLKTHNFRLTSLEPQMKDGGVFVKFQYDAQHTDVALQEILKDLRERVANAGGVPSWSGFPRGDVWLVKGRPWQEDLHRYASPALRVTFEGPDVNEETLYDLFRPYGRIMDISQPAPVPAGSLRSSMVVFRQIRAAAAARNALHGLRVTSGPSTSPTFTRLRTNYQPPIQAHAIRDYITNHPKIFLPVLFFLLGTLTYTIFDPIRVLMVEGKMTGWFDYKELALYKWLWANTVERFSLISPPEERSVSASKQYLIEGVWQERQRAEKDLERYLSDMPSTVAFVHGPQGGGKTQLLNTVLKDAKRRTIIIDVRELTKTTSETQLVSKLAAQTGYRPVFSFLNSVNGLIDLASVGLIGQKTGLSSSLSEQLQKILEVVSIGLKRVNVSYRQRRRRELKAQQVKELRKQDEARIREEISQGIWHDGRLDCVAGNGVMSELGVGDEPFGRRDADAGVAWTSASDIGEKTNGEDVRRGRLSKRDRQEIDAIPVVVLRNFEIKGGSTQRETMMDALSQWAATLIENQVAHVIVISDNRENSKRLAKALPTKPLTLIGLSDADNKSALSFVKQRLLDAGVDVEFSKDRVSHVERLGGRANDLESLIHKVRNGQSIEDAVEDIIVRGASELRKNAFGDDLEDAKNLPWSREQAWILMKRLANKNEVPYHDALIDFPFKGDEAALRNMEHAELISIVTQNGRPSAIRPGKPVYKYVFERLVNDPIFQATQDIAYNMKVIASAETMIKNCEQELLVLKDVEAATAGFLWGSRRAVTQRTEYLLKNMKIAGGKIENAEKQNVALKKTLAKGG